MKSCAGSVVNYNDTLNRPIVESVQSGGGAIFYVPWNVSDVYFKKNVKYCQYGLCNSKAVLPTIITTGEGRISYKTDTNTNGYIHITMTDSLIPIESATVILFIGGDPGLIIRDLYAVMVKPS